MSTDVTGKPIALAQLEAELAAALVVLPNGLGMNGPSVNDPTVTLFTFDAEGAATDLPAEANPVVDAHVALRDKTDEEYAAEFQQPTTTALRRQEIRDITAGLLPREQVRIDNGLPLEDPPVQEDPLAVIKGVPLGSTTDELRDAIVDYLERFGG